MVIDGEYSDAPTDQSKKSSALEALAQVAQEHGIELPAEALALAHRFEGDEPSTAQLMQIAAASGLTARSVRLARGQLGSIIRTAPAILRFSDGRSLILMKVNKVEIGHVALIRDAFAPAEAFAAVDEEALFREWQGDLVLIKPRRAASAADRPFGLGWLVAEVLREKAIFRDIGLGAVVTSILALVPPMIFMVAIDRVITHRSFATLYVLFIGLGVAIACETGLTYLRRFFLEVATSRIDARLSTYVFHRLLNLPLSFFEQNSTGAIAGRIGEIWRIRNFLTGQLFTTILDGVTLIFLIPVMFYLNWKLAFMVLALAGCVAGVYVIFIPGLRIRHARVVKAEIALGSHQIETIHGIRAVKSLALDGLKRRERDVKLAEAVEARTLLGRYANYPQTIVLPIERFIYMGSLGLGCYMVLVGDPSLSPGMIIAFSIVSSRVAAPLIGFANLLQASEEVRSAISVVGSVINQPAEGGRSGSGLKQPIRGAVTFQDVRFRYSPQATYALDRVSFEIPEGTIFGIMGRSGSGKSTITRMLQGLQRDYDGIIKIDGMDLREIDLDHLRRNAGIVLQENFLFTGTIRENISAARSNAGFEQVVRAAQLAGAEEFIERLPRGYETLIEEGAVNFSGGQRQRLAIARTLLADPPIIMLDEATSALDAESEAIVNANLMRMARGRTMIIISHRLSSLIDADQILVMERGKVYDIGPHDVLLARCDIYKQLWYQQNRHLDPENAHVRRALA